MAVKRNKYLIWDYGIERAFVCGDLKVVGAITGRSHRTVIKWFANSDFYNDDRFVIAKNPMIIKTRHKPYMSEKFLKHKWKKKDESNN